MEAARITDTSAFGIPHSNHSKHRVYIDGLTHKQALVIKWIANLLILKWKK